MGQFQERLSPCPLVNHFAVLCDFASWRETNQSRRIWRKDAKFAKEGKLGITLLQVMIFFLGGSSARLRFSFAPLR